MPVTDTVIKESHRPRRVGGVLLLLLGLILTTPIFLVGLSGIDSFGDAAILLPGPFLMALGFWGAFPRHSPKIRLRIDDDVLTIEAKDKTISLDEIVRIKYSIPTLSKHYRLTFCTAQGEIPFDLIHLTHEGRDIINLIGIRLEKQGKLLKQTRTAVMGALTGVWEVQSGMAFVTDPKHDRITYGRE